ncbi:hypothetical protein C789_964 [Microcystis aeruginosa FACHB-905 = DIANCHI905]|nr:hypothetical protein C789_964 [Microcystis aeruginosa FACHB-905 = DIANCHI905]
MNGNSIDPHHKNPGYIRSLYSLEKLIEWKLLSFGNHSKIARHLSTR